VAYPFWATMGGGIRSISIAAEAVKQRRFYEKEGPSPPSGSFGSLFVCGYHGPWFYPPVHTGRNLACGLWGRVQKAHDENFSILTDKTGVSVEPVFGNMQQILAQAKASGTLQVLIGDKAFLEASSIPLSMFKPIGRGRLVLASSRG